LGNFSLNVVQVYIKKKLLVLVNPRGGSGKAMQICNRVSPNLGLNLENSDFI